MYCAPDAVPFANDISTITPDSTVLGYQSQSVLGTSALTTSGAYFGVDGQTLTFDGQQAPSLYGGHTPGGPSMYVGRPMVGGADAALHLAALGSAAPPPPTQAPAVPVDERRIDPHLGGLAVTYDEMVRQHGAQGRSAGQDYWVQLQVDYSYAPGTGLGAASPQQAYSATHPATLAQLQRFQVYQEDCILDVKGQQLHLPTSPSRALAVGSKAAQDATIHREVYVQHMMDVERFKPVPVQRMKSAFGNVKPQPGSQRVSSRRIELWTSCTALDPDARELQTRDGIDVDILELLARSEECHTIAAAVFLTLQALLAGISIIGGMLAFGVGNSSELEQVLKLLEPGFGCLSLVMAEIICVGNGFRLLKAWDKVVIARANSIEESGVDMREGTKWSLTHQVGLNALRLCINTLFLVSCLVGARGNVLLSTGVATNSVTFSSGTVVDLENTGTNSSIDGIESPFASNSDINDMGPQGPEWPGDLARQLLMAQSVLGILALAFAASDLFDLISPRRSPSSASATLLDDSQDPQLQLCA